MFVPYFFPPPFGTCVRRPCCLLHFSSVSSVSLSGYSQKTSLQFSSRGKMIECKISIFILTIPVKIIFLYLKKYCEIKLKCRGVLLSLVSKPCFTELKLCIWGSPYQSICEKSLVIIENPLDPNLSVLWHAKASY